MQALSDLNPATLNAILLSLCYLLIAIGILKIALFLLMTLTPRLWDALIKKENALYIRMGLLNKKGSEIYTELERGPWAKAFFGCGGLAVIFFAVLIIAFVRLIQSLPFQNL